MQSLFNYIPRHSHEVRVGNRPLGGDNPIRLQSMTTCSTDDVAGCVAQAERIIKAGADYVRFTTQGSIEVENLSYIRADLRRHGFTQPLVADVHFNPHVADLAACVVEKVRINPGNYVDPARTFRHLEYTDEEYAAELQRLETRFKQLLQICREHGTALRIGVNHGSLSDRIMCRYGDTPEGIVESCMEFLRVCMKELFLDVVVSIKASNTAIMVRSVRLLCAAMEREGMDFPLHLGVTEAGEGEDGRIKSAVGIGSLLADGIGDTIRVSLSEEPECEIPVAHKLARYVTATRGGHPEIPATPCPEFDYLNPQRRPTSPVLNIGGTNAPVVLAYYPNEEGRPREGEQTMQPDYAYYGKKLPAERTDSVGYIVDADVWKDEKNVYPAYAPTSLFLVAGSQAKAKFLFLTYLELNDEVKACLRQHPEMVVLATSYHANPTGELRALVHELWREHITTPVVFLITAPIREPDKEYFQLRAAADAGGLLFDGLTDGLGLMPYTFRTSANPQLAKKGFLDIVTVPYAVAPAVETAFAILQAARLRTTKTEYISCPGCGRTLYDLQGTIARIKAATSHLTGLKIAVMGCIVNGPGEMADADYGYVGAARGKVSLYRGRTCVEKNIPEADAVEHLLALIEADGRAATGTIPAAKPQGE